MKSCLTIFLFVIALHFCIAQNFQFSQYNFTTTRVNPAWLGLTKYFTTDFLYRNQKTGGDFSINDSYLSLAYPLVRQSTGTSWSGIGISLLDDRSGGIYKSQEVSLSYAVNVSTGKYQNLSLGVRGLLRTQRIDYSGLFTGLQYVEGRGFDPSASSGENLLNSNIHYFTFSTGLLWQKTDRRGSLVSQFDAALYDFNNPNNSFTGDGSKLSSSSVVHASLLLKKYFQLNTYTDALFTYGNGKPVMNIGARWQYDLNPKSKTLTDKVDLITRYVIGRSGIAGVQFHKENFSLGLSYDFPIVIKNQGNTGAVEVALEYRTPVSPRDKKPRKKSAKKISTQKAKQPSKSIVVKRPIPTPTVTMVDSISKPITKPIIAKVDTVSKIIQNKIGDEDTVQLVTIVKNDSVDLNGRVTAGKVKHEPLVVEKITLHFHFEYNSVDLDDETENFLKELSVSLLENENLKIKITGHTDDRGNAKYNQRLSLIRADEVKKYLAKLGIDKTRIETEGKGMTEPLNGNSTEEERAKNRRVEIKVLYD